MKENKVGVLYGEGRQGGCVRIIEVRSGSGRGLGPGGGGWSGERVVGSKVGGRG